MNESSREQPRHEEREYSPCDTCCSLTNFVTNLLDLSDKQPQNQDAPAHFLSYFTEKHYKVMSDDDTVSDQVDRSTR